MPYIKKLLAKVKRIYHTIHVLVNVSGLLYTQSLKTCTLGSRPKEGACPS
jgi:hypothetical protein